MEELRDELPIDANAKRGSDEQKQDYQKKNLTLRKKKKALS